MWEKSCRGGRIAGRIYQRKTMAMMLEDALTARPDFSDGLTLCHVTCDSLAGTSASTATP